MALDICNRGYLIVTAGLFVLEIPIGAPIGVSKVSRHFSLRFLGYILDTKAVCAILFSSQASGRSQTRLELYLQIFVVPWLRVMLFRLRLLYITVFSLLSY